MKKRNVRLVVACILLVGVCGISSVRADWTVDGVRVTYLVHADVELSTCSIAPDGAGGALIAFGAGDPYGHGSNNGVHKIDGDGNLLWDGDAVYFSCMRWAGCPQTAIDGAGGVFVACSGVDAAGMHYICTGRIQSDGTETFFGVSNTATWKENPAIIPHSLGGAIIAWAELPGGADKNIMAQRVDSGGDSLWNGSGVPVCTDTDYQEKPHIVSDSMDGAIIVWTDRRNGNDDIYAQHVNGSGVPTWTANGVAICTNSYDQLNIDVISDGIGGAVIAWMDRRNGDRDVFAQRIDMSGNVQWAADGLRLCAVAGDQDHPRLVRSGAGGTIAAWADQRSGDYDIYAQCLDSSGAFMWDLSGVAVIAGTGDQAGHAIVTDGGLGAIIAWSDTRASDYDIYAQKIDWLGDIQWLTTGVPVCTATESQHSLVMTADGFGGAVVAWLDNREGFTGYEYDVYSTRILEGLAPVATLLQGFDAYPMGAAVTITWTLSGIEGGASFFILRSEGEEGEFREIPAAGIAREELSFSYRDNSVESGSVYRYRVDVTGADGRRMLFETGPVRTPALALTLEQNHPNPFNPATTIGYFVPSASHVTLEVFDTAGRRIALLVDEEQAMGLYSIDWNGLGNEGSPVSSGTYFYRLTAGKETISHKMILLR
jgi:hypothetical protein